MQHHQGEKVVGGTAHIAVQDDADVLLLIIAPDVDTFRKVVNRVLTVLPGKLQGCRKAVFGEDAGRVEIVFFLHGIIPAADHIVVGVGGGMQDRKRGSGHEVL